MSRKLKLTKLSLETKDGKQVELSIDEARELHEQLHSLFGEKTTTYIPSAPVIIERDQWRPPYQPYWYGDGIICGDSTDASKNIRPTYDTQCTIKSLSGLSVNYCGHDA